MRTKSSVVQTIEYPTPTAVNIELRCLSFYLRHSLFGFETLKLMHGRVNKVTTAGEIALVSIRMKTGFGFSWISVSNSSEKLYVDNLGVC